MGGGEVRDAGKQRKQHLVESGEADPSLEFDSARPQHACRSRLRNVRRGIEEHCLADTGFPDYQQRFSVGAGSFDQPPDRRQLAAPPDEGVASSGAVLRKVTLV
jgi:hypothetical protein